VEYDVVPANFHILDSPFRTEIRMRAEKHPQDGQMTINGRCSFQIPGDGTAKFGADLSLPHPVLKRATKQRPNKHVSLALALASISLVGLRD
jgi:hypothetical protein